MAVRLESLISIIKNKRTFNLIAIMKKVYPFLRGRKNKGFFHWECYVLLFRHFPKYEYTETTFHIQFNEDSRNIKRKIIIGELFSVACIQALQRQKSRKYTHKNKEKQLFCTLYTCVFHLCSFHFRSRPVNEVK